jgi:4'-phosphopantetheinyl transferase
MFYADVSALDTIDPVTANSWLNQSELEHIERLHFTHDKILYKLSHCMLRWVLSQYLNLAPEQIEFNINDFGKPRLKLNSDIFFNISHTNGVAVMAVSKIEQLGIDIEKINSEKEVSKVVTHYFHPEETNLIESLATGKKVKIFYTIWTLKEAYIKAKGLGLSIELNRFNFKLPTEDLLEVIFEKELNEESNLWQFAVFESEQHKNFIISVAAKCSQLNIKAYNIQLGKNNIIDHPQNLLRRNIAS